MDPRSGASAQTAPMATMKNVIVLVDQVGAERRDGKAGLDAVLFPIQGSV